MTGTYTPSGLKKSKQLIKHTTKVKIDHTKRQLLTHKASPEPLKPYNEFFGGSEGLIGPPLPRLDCKDVPVIELLLYDRCNQYQGTAKDKTNMINQTHLNIISIKNHNLRVKISLNDKFCGEI